MTVKEILIAAATELNIASEVEGYLNGSMPSAKKQTDTLLKCFNIVENALAMDYLPLIVEEEIVSSTGTVHFSQLQRKAVRIIGVTDGAGNESAYKLFPEYITAQAGKLRVKYCYAPEEKTLEGESDFILYASVRLFAYGIAAEYALINGMYEDVGMWDKKYKQAIAAAYRSSRNKRIRARRWV